MEGHLEKDIGNLASNGCCGFGRWGGIPDAVETPPKTSTRRKKNLRRVREKMCGSIGEKHGGNLGEKNVLNVLGDH